MPNYSWLTINSAVAQLSQRLNDPANTFWTAPECVIYIKQSLRMFNCLTFTWKSEFSFVPSTLWNSLGALSGSPRLRTQTDIDCYTQMEYMLIEPPTGGTWTGTSQFAISDLSAAVQSRRDEMIQAGNLNQVLLPNLPITPNARRTNLPDNVLDVQRVRFLPSSGMPVTLYRDDIVASEFYEAPLYQQNPGTPQAFAMSSEPPLAFDVDIAPSQPGTYEAVTLQSGTSLNPPGATPLNIPDDFTWALVYGSLGDVLESLPESSDPERAAYCKKRYQDGLLLLQKIPWIMLGSVNGVAVSCDSIFDTDRYSPNWDTIPGAFGPVIVTGGVDFFAAPVGSSVGITCLGNAPVPTTGGSFVQVDRADWDTVLDLAQAMAMFKQGGADWKEGLELESRAIQACAAENSRLRSFGAFSDILVQRGQAQDRSMNRYNVKGDQG